MVAGKEVALIGSGATAVTILPSIAESAAQLTLVQGCNPIHFCVSWVLAWKQLTPVLKLIWVKRGVLHRKWIRIIIPRFLALSTSRSGGDQQTRNNDRSHDIHLKLKKNPHEKPSVDSPPRFFTQIFREYLCIRFADLCILSHYYLIPKDANNVNWTLGDWPEHRGLVRDLWRDCLLRKIWTFLWLMSERTLFQVNWCHPYRHQMCIIRHIC